MLTNQHTQVMQELKGCYIHQVNTQKKALGTFSSSTHLTTPYLSLLVSSTFVHCRHDLIIENSL